MKKIVSIAITLFLTISLGEKVYAEVYAEERHCMSDQMKHPSDTYSPPYGAYCPGHRWGWYGASREVKSIEEARNILIEYCASANDIKIGRIKERKRFFEAEIYDKDNNLIDRVLIDKKTGRMRSIY